MAVDTKQFMAVGPLQGHTCVPGDKSITHRAILFGLLAHGMTTVHDWLDGADCRSSIHVAEQLGAVVQVEPHLLTIHGTGGDLHEPTDVLDCGNSGTTTRMFLGALAARVPFACLTGDKSLRARPMKRVVHPLLLMGANIQARAQQYLPLAVDGARLQGMNYKLPVPSAQVKSAILIAGMLADTGPTTVVETVCTRDHTENMLPAFGVKVLSSTTSAGTELTVQPNQQLRGTTVRVPGDPSSAAFLLAAAAMIPESMVTVEGVALNLTRIGFLKVLGRMGAQILMCNTRVEAGEQVGDITVTAAPLQGTVITAEEIASLVDEIPVLCMVAAIATGETTVQGAEELRIKETDRIEAVCAGLNAVGVRTESRPDGLTVYGMGHSVIGGNVQSYHDHRIAMSFAILGLASEQGVRIQHWSCVDVSFPNFEQTLVNLTKKADRASRLVY